MSPQSTTCPRCGDATWYDSPDYRTCAGCNYVQFKDLSAASDQTGRRKIGKEEVLPRVITDLHLRAEKGMKTYGGPLETFNGRSALWDAYQEAIDLVMYLKQLIMETESGPAPVAASVDAPYDYWADAPDKSYSKCICTACDSVTWVKDLGAYWNCKHCGKRYDVKQPPASAVAATNLTELFDTTIQAILTPSTSETTQKDLIRSLILNLVAQGWNSIQDWEESAFYSLEKVRDCFEKLYPEKFVQRSILTKEALDIYVRLSHDRLVTFLACGYSWGNDIDNMQGCVSAEAIEELLRLGKVKRVDSSFILAGHTVPVSEIVRTTTVSEAIGYPEDSM